MKNVGKQEKFDSAQSQIIIKVVRSFSGDFKVKYRKYKSSRHNPDNEKPDSKIYQSV